MPRLTPEQLAFVQKHDAKLKAADKKFDALVAELSRARQRLVAKPPAGVEPDLAGPYVKNQAELVKLLGFLDRYLADMKRDVKEYLTIVKRSLDEGRR